MRNRRLGLILVLLGCAFFLLRGIHDEHRAFHACDFLPVYSGARCMVSGCNPYSPDALLRVDRSAGPKSQQNFFTVDLSTEDLLYPPSTLVLITPFGAMPWRAAHLLWLALTGGSFVVASLLMWELCADDAPVIAGLLLGGFTATSTLLIMTGNPAGLSISLCVVAVWCFLRKRLLWPGVVCMALSLLLKPQDAGFIWLYFVLASAEYRRLALKALVLAAVVSLPAIAWVMVSTNSWHWIGELHGFVTASMAHNGTNDPSIGNDTSYKFLNLQALFSVIRDDPSFYVPLSYAIAGSMLLLWMVVSARRTASRKVTYVALAAGSALTMLPVYHRIYDWRLLLLMFPAVMLMWRQRDRARWRAMGSLAVMTGISMNPMIHFLQVVQRFTRQGPIWLEMTGRPYCVMALLVAIVWLWMYVQAARQECKTPVDVEEVLLVS